MNRNQNIRRRDFLVTAALAGAPSILAQKNPNSVIGVACVGVGTRGHLLMKQVQDIPNTEVRVVCDLYQSNIRRAKELSTNPKMKIVREWEKAVTDPDVDVVLIATPDFWHAPMTVRAAQAKKDIYVEKGWCKTLAEAKEMRAAVLANRSVLQLGHHYNSLPTFVKAREIYRSGQLGKTPVVRTYIDRTNAYPEWQFYGDYDKNVMPKDAGPDTIDWERFIANASKRPFDAKRFFLWRYWWEYGNGIAGDLMSHLWDSVNMVVGMGIPESAIAHGAQYFWHDGRDVPDIWDVAFDYPKQELSVTFQCTFNSKHVPEMAQYLGRDMTLEVGPHYCNTYPAEWKQRDSGAPPEFKMTERSAEGEDHMKNFIDCVRSRELPRCNVHRAWEEAVTIMMSVEAYRREKKVRWDPVNETIV